MKSWNLLPIGCLAVLLVGCVGSGQKTGGDGLAATMSGGLIGSSSNGGRSSSPGVSSWLGSWATTDLARQLDDKDRQLASEAEYDALDNGGPGVAREWHNAATGRRGAVTPGPAYSVNQYTCRDYVDVISFDGRQEVRRGTACHQPDGTWRPIS